MALALLQKVAEKTISTLGGAATSAWDYLSKNAPQAIDRALESNPQTRLFSQQGQKEAATVGQFLQKVPSYTFKPTPERTFIDKPSNIMGGILTGAANIPNDIVRGWGQTIERTATPEGRTTQWEGAKSLPGQVAGIFTQPGHRLENLGKVVQNPALQDTLNAIDLFSLGAGTALKASGKEATEQGIKQLIKKGGRTLAKEGIEGGEKTGFKTIVKQMAEEGAPKVTKTSELFTGGNGIPSTDDYLFPGVNQVKDGEYVAKNGIKIKTQGGLGEAIDQATTIPKSPETTTFGGKTDKELAMDALQNDRNQGKSVATSEIMSGATPIDGAGKATKTLFQKPEDIAKRWINTREGFTNWRAADIKKTPGLTAFDKDGMNAIVELQSGKNPEKFKAVQDFTDGLFELEKKAGLMEPENYRRNYIPQLWDNTPEEIDAVFKKTVGGKAGFTKARVLEDYKAGIDAGLTPRYNTVSDLLESRFKSSQRALADVELVDNLWANGQAKTLDKAPPGWELVDLKYQNKPIAVPPEVASLVKKYTSEGTPWIEKTAQFVSEAKQSLLSAGIPKTGWNFHTGVNIPARRMAASNPLSGAVDSLIWNSNPKSALNYIEKVVPKDITDGLLKAGLNISRSSEGSGYGFKPKEGVSKFSKMRTGFDRLFSEAAFDKILPAHKLKVGWETYQNAIKQGVSPDQAYKIAADASNTVFGGVNPDTLGRSKDFQNVMRTLLLAPDWLESNIKIAGGIGGLTNPKNWAKPEYAPYKKFATNAAGMYTSFAMLNKALSGHFPWENGQGQEFNLATGTYDERGRERMVPAFGTAFDFVRIPLQMVQAGLEGDLTGIARPLRNRLSPPASAVASLALTGEDYRGRPIDTPGEVAGQVAQAVGVPSQITNVIGGLTGEQTPEEVAAGLLEAPLRYRGGARTADNIKTADMLKAGGSSNKQINQAFDKSGSQSKSGGWFDGLMGGGSSGVDIKLPKTKSEKQNFDKSVDTALSNGASDLPEDVIVTRFFDGKTYNKSARSGQQDILDAALKVSNDEYLTPEQKTSIIGAAKIDPTDLQYYRTSSLDQADRLEGLLMYASEDHKDRDAFVQDLLLGKRAVGGKSMFSTAMYERLYDEGLISKEEKALITAVKYDPVFNKFYMDRDYKGGGSLGGSDGSSGNSVAQVRSYVSSVNALHRSPFKKSTLPKGSDIAENTEVPAAPRFNFSKTPKRSGKTQNQWFTSY